MKLGEEKKIINHHQDKIRLTTLQKSLRDWKPQHSLVSSNYP